MNFTAAKCPVCGADIQVDGERTNCFCMYCGSQIQVQSAINSVSIDGVASANAILTRAYQFLQTSEFEKANEYFLRVLDLEPTNANAFLGQLLAVIKSPNSSSATIYVKDYNQYRFAYQYGDEGIRAELEALNEKSKERFEKEMNAATLKPSSMTLSFDSACSFLWGSDDRPDGNGTNDYEQLREQMCNSERFESVVYPAVAIYDSECSTIQDVLPSLEIAVNKKCKMILFVRSCDDELWKTLFVNCARGTFNCELVCINDASKLRELAMFCGTTCNGGTVPNLKNAYIEGKKIVLVK